MFFKGTERRPTARDIAGEIDAIGGEFNAFTSKEYTGYYVKCAAEHRDIALDVLVDMLRHSKFDPDEIEREKGVIVEEMNMYFDTPRDSIGGVYESLLFGDQPLGRDIIGRKETVQDATRDTFLDYLGPLVPAVADGRRARRQDRRRRPSSASSELLGDLEDLPGADGAEPAKPFAKGRVKLKTKESDQAHLILGAPSLPLAHPDRYALSMVATVLGGGMSSRLFTEVRERRGLGYYVFGVNHSYTDAGTLYSQAGVDIARIDDAVTTIVGELRRIADEPVPPDELEKARNFSKGRFVLQLESPQGTIMFGLRREVLEGRRGRPGGGARRDQRGHGRGRPAGRARGDPGNGGMRLAVVGPFDDAKRTSSSCSTEPTTIR